MYVLGAASVLTSRPEYAPAAANGNLYASIFGVGPSHSWFSSGFWRLRVGSRPAQLPQPLPTRQGPAQVYRERPLPSFHMRIIQSPCLLSIWGIAFTLHPPRMIFRWLSTMMESPYRSGPDCSGDEIVTLIVLFGLVAVLALLLALPRCLIA